MGLFNIFTKNTIGIDLGTSNSLVYVLRKEIILNEPSVVATSVDDNSILAVGNEAQDMIGKTPDTIVAQKPLKDGAIADYRVTEAMLRYFISKSCSNMNIQKPDVIVSVSSGITSTERRAIIQATKNAGAKNVYMIKEPILAAIGAGVSVNSASGSMVIDIGGGTTEVAIISLGGIVVSESSKVGGEKMDSSITSHIKNKYNVAIGERIAEKIKIEIGSATLQKTEQETEVNGRDLISGLPKNIKVKSNDISEAISKEVQEILQTVKKVFRETPPELVSDIMERGMLLSGGVSLLYNLDTFLSEEIGVPAIVAEDPMLCVIQGAGVAMENIEVYKRSVMNKR